LQHIWLAVFPTLLAVVLAVPPAVFLAHLGRGKFAANTLVNLGRAIPSFGILVLAAILFIRARLDFRFWPTVLALLVLAVPPIFTNTYAGVANVSPALIEAGRGMGFREAEIVRRLEIPVAAPVILAGVEIAFVQVVATVPLAAVISNGGGLGLYIVRGFAQGAGAADETFAGALLVGAMTLVMQQAFSIGERVLLPPGIRRLRVRASS
jgi:osmoprotectant transport system permease protein